MYQKTFSFVIIFLCSVYNLSAQCAMCKTTVVNNVSNVELSLAQGLNYGIVYLFVSPYIAIFILAYFWYKTSKKKSNLV